MEQKITIKQVNVTKHLELQVVSDGDINYNDMLTLEYDGETYYFKPIEVIINNDGTTAVVKECGYWADGLYRKKDLNYRDLLGMEMSIETDKEVIKRVNVESTYC